MWAGIDGKVLGIFGRLWDVVALYPALSAAYFGSMLLFAALSAWFIYRQESQRAYWCAVGVVLVISIFSMGDDTFTHVYRTIGLTEQLRSGKISLLLTNPATGEVLPTFVYYSVLPYLPPVLLNLAGLPAMAAFKVTIVGLFLTLAWGVAVLVWTTASHGASRRQENIDFLTAILFVSANYVYALWTTRASLAELWVYAFVPWVVRYMMTPKSAIPLIGLLFLQICGHPIVLLQSLVCELIVAFALSRNTLWEFSRRCTGPLVAALAIALPFWLPQSLWQDFILGPAALPGNFAESFVGIGKLLDPRYSRSVGLWLPMAMGLLILVSGARLAARIWLLISAFVVLMALQSTYLQGLTMQIPMLGLSLFVWRLMIPAAFLAFGALLMGWRTLGQRSTRGLAVLAAVSILFMVSLSISISTQYIPVVAAVKNDRSYHLNYDRGDGIWGIREFHPNYTGLQQACGGSDSREVTVGELRAGIRTDRAYVSVWHGPVGLVDYELDGASVRLTACGRNLVFGPLEIGKTLRLSESKLNVVLALRGLSVALCLLIVALPFARRGRRQ